MSFFTEITAVNPRPTIESNILGATGLSRATLAAMFRREGLFGPDSAFSTSEQAVVLACLRIPGLPSASVMPETTARLEVLKHMTMFLLRSGGVASADVKSRLAAAGFDKSARRELWRVVKIAGDVFGVGAGSPRIEGSVVLDADPAWA